MSADQYVLWFIGMAVAILLILGTGTLIMSGVVRRPRGQQDETSARGHLTVHEGGRHHWYDRFHRAA